MNNLAIQVEGLSKQYYIGSLQKKYKYKTLRDVIVDSHVVSSAPGEEPMGWTSDRGG